MLVFLNNIALLYQGVSDLFNIHLQSGIFLRTIQVFFPRAPLKWAIDVSHVMIKSQLTIIAAVSINASPSLSISSLKDFTGKSILFHLLPFEGW